jgi:glutamate/tyrosine decarboxylase-like PLP-dependent enzyme
VQPTTTSETSHALKTAVDAAISYLDRLDHTSVAPTASAETLRARLSIPLSDEATPPDRVIQELVEAAECGLTGSAGGRFFAWVVGGALPAALAADWLTSAWDQNAALHATSPAAAIVEEVAGVWLKELLGLPATASFAIVNGCQMAHLTGLAAARHALLARRGWNVETQGLYGAPPIRILTSDQRHGSFERAVRLVGMGTGHIQRLRSNDRDELDAAALEQALATDPSAPTIVLLQAGEINLGAYDDFTTLIPLAHRYDAWVHIDGAFGLWAAASPRYRQLMRGCDAADSWATDGHKWLNTPYDCGYAFVADAESHRAAMSHRAPYLTHAGDARDQMDWNPEWSRRARGFSTYAAIRELGRSGVADLVDRCCRFAHAIVTGIGKLPGAELLWEPVINQGLVRFPDPRAGATPEDHDHHTTETIAAINATGEAFFSGTTWRGRAAMRVSVSSWRTTDDDVRRTVDAVARVLAQQDSSLR